MSKMQRNLDGVYFRVRRDGRWQNVCFSDLEQAERGEMARMIAEQRTLKEQAAYWCSVADLLADRLYDMGEQLGVMCK